jgi:hypothetical protein
MAIACDRVRDLAPGFVLEALDAADMAALREHLSTCPKPHSELREMGGVVPYLGGSLDPVEPPKHLRAAVMAAAQADLRARSAEKAAPAVVAPETAPVLTVIKPVRSAGVVSLARVRALRTRRAATWITRVAAAVVIVGLVGHAVAVQGDLNHAHDAQATTNNFYDILDQPGARSAVLAPEAGRKGAGDAVLLPSGHVEVLLHGLAPTKGDEVYMVWSSVDSGAVTKAGWFTVDDTGVGYLKMDNVPPSDSLWLMVCHEPDSGVVKPTGPVIVTGTIWVYSVPAATPTD